MTSDSARHCCCPCHHEPHAVDTAIREEWRNQRHAGHVRPSALRTHLRAAQRRRVDAEGDLRVLIAFAREFHTPKPIRLEDVAADAGLSISGVRTAYGDEQIRHIADVLEP